MSNYILDGNFHNIFTEGQLFGVKSRTLKDSWLIVSAFNSKIFMSELSYCFLNSKKKKKNWKQKFRQFESPTHTSLTFAPQNIWVCDYKGGKIYIIVWAGVYFFTILQTTTRNLFTRNSIYLFKFYYVELIRFKI